MSGKPLTPATALVVGLAGIGLADPRKFLIPLLLGPSIAVTFASVAFGVFPL